MAVLEPPATPSRLQSRSSPKTLAVFEQFWAPAKSAASSAAARSSAAWGTAGAVQAETELEFTFFCSITYHGILSIL